MTRCGRCTCMVVVSLLLGCGAGSPPGSAASLLDDATQLDRRVDELNGAGRFGDALAPAQRSAQLRERVLGSRSPALATSLNRLAELHLRLGAYGEAEPLLVRALEIDEKALGPMHLDVATSARNLGEVHHGRGEFDKAMPLYARALDIREKALGPMHPEVARGLSSVAALHRAQGAYDKAEPLSIRALDIVEKALGPRHPEVARMANNLGKLYRMVGAYDKAHPLHARALDVAEEALGPWHPDLVHYLNDMASLHWVQGAFGKAEPLYARALEIAEKAFGPMHRDVALSLGNLGMTLQDLGAHGRAEPLYLRALEIQEKTLGPMHPNLAAALNNLASLYWEQGALDKAERVLRRALDITEQTLGESHADVGQSLQSLALVCHTAGAHDKAEQLYARALAITENALGPTHLEVERILTNLAWLYRDQAMYGKAEPLLVRALAIHQSVPGPTHPRAAVTLQNLAAVYRDQRAYHKAEPLLVRALGLVESGLGPMHPDTALVLQSLARLAWVRGASGDAEPLLARAAEIREAQLRVELPRLSEPRKRALMTFLQDETDSVVSLHAHAAPRSPRALELGLTTTLRRKGRILDSLVDNEAALRAHLTPELREQLDQLDRARSEIVALLYTPRDATDRAAITAVRARIDDLETRLSAASAVFRAQSEPVTVAKVQAAVPPGAALVELVRYNRFDPKEVQWRREERYIAYVVTRERLQWVALGEAAPIDAQVDAMLAAMDDKAPAATARAALRRLDARVLAPIRARLTGISHLIVAPDGKLNLVPFEALVDERLRHAVDSYTISYVTTGRDLLRFAAPPPRSPSVLVAGPDYGPLPTPPSAVSFAPLDGALAEAADLEKYFRAPPLTGEKATKTALKALTGPALLHIATHGFYAQTRGPRPPPTPGNTSREMFSDPDSPLLPPPRPDDPADGLDRAGLAMAGANRGPDGIVTAREIAGFDWWGTQLVVLSACESGVGAVRSGDGVYGLRRALVLAGTASQVVSLWAVDDASTRLLMRDYYAELARGTGRAEALRAAKRRLMHEPRYAHPHYWAAFIAAGDWQPVDRSAIVQRSGP
jgi:CHAT domain-containing protein/tetratricopeptide (TPR) repeat protein